MKKSSKINIQSIGIMLVLTILIAIPFSCKKMDEVKNIDEKMLPYGPYVPGSLLANMQYNVIINLHWQYQEANNLSADAFSGYMMSDIPFRGNRNNYTYDFQSIDWNNRWVKSLNQDIINPWLEVKTATKDKNTDLDMYSIALILKVMAASRVTDVFGPIPYGKIAKGVVDPAWDCQQEVYTNLFADLNEAISTLTTVENSNATLDLLKFAAYDKSNLGGDYKNWVQVANTMKLRLAIRIAKADPAKAEIEAESAVSHPFGLLTSMPFKITPGASSHPLNTISLSWLNASFGAPLGALLNGYADPRLPLYALPATDPLCLGQYIGIRQGIDITPNTYSKYSRLNFKPTDGIQLMSSSESFFLRAEGILNGWDMKGAGSAEIFYKDGVKASFTERNLTGAEADAYLTDMTNNKSSAYIDYHNAANNVPLGDPILSTIPKQFGGTPAEQLEKIITQKWIAIYPDGMEAWSEHRRTGYPKLWPVKLNYSGGTIPMGEFVKRLPYPSDLTTNSIHYPPSCLNGPDNGNTKLWWNK